MSTQTFAPIGGVHRVPSPLVSRVTTPAPFPFPRLYRAHVQPARDSRAPELTVFVEAATHQAAIRKIANAVAIMETRLPDAIEDRIYNCYSARELIEDGASEDIELRLFETGWSGDRAVSFVDAPLFLVAAPALIRKWATVAEVAHV
jgi:hypothetical protein